MTENDDGSEVDEYNIDNRDEDLVVFVNALAEEEGKGDNDVSSGECGCEDDDDNPNGKDDDYDDLFHLPGTNGRPGPMGFNI